MDFCPNPARPRDLVVHGKMGYMPNRVYRARYEPPKWWEHILAHPGNSVASVWWVFMGYTLVITSFWNPQSMAAGILWALPDVVAFVLGSALILAGAVNLWAILTNRRNRKWVWSMHQASLLVAMPAWLALAVLSFMAFPGQVLVWTLCGLNAVLAVITLAGSTREEHLTRGQGV